MSLSWANLFAAEIAKISKVRYCYDSPWVESLGTSDYSSSYNFRAGSQMTIWTDATELTLSIANNYSSVWEWYVNDTLLEGYSTTSTIQLDGEFNKVTVKFTSGRAITPTFELSKTITFENVAVSGVSTQNIIVPSGKDWLLIMVGTNDRGSIPMALKNSFWEYAGKGTYIVPFPNHKAEASYVVSQMQVYSTIREIFASHSYEIIDCSDVAGIVFAANSMYQQDLIHFNEDGHRAIANIVSGRMGLPMYL